MNRIKTLMEGTKEIPVELTDDQFNKFLNFKELIKEWNEKIDITTIIEDEDMDIKHFLDSLSLVPTGLFDSEKKILDMGTGGGFPGVPLKIYNEDLDITLMDSLNKRIVFLQDVIDKLGFNKIQAIHGRAEELGRQKNHREAYDICVSRAVASMETLVEYCLPFVKPSGYFIAMKGPSPHEEVKRAEKGIKTLGGELVDYYNVKIPKSDIEHSIVIIKKLKNTPKKYPRGGGKPRKNPL